MRFVVCENESCLPSFSFIPKMRMSEYFVLGLKERQWETGTCYNFFFFIIVCLTHTHKNYHSKKNTSGINMQYT